MCLQVRLTAWQWCKTSLDSKDHDVGRQPYVILLTAAAKKNNSGTREDWQPQMY